MAQLLRLFLFAMCVQSLACVAQQGTPRSMLTYITEVQYYIINFRYSIRREVTPKDIQDRSHIHLVLKGGEAIIGMNRTVFDQKIDSIPHVTDKMDLENMITRASVVVKFDNGSEQMILFYKDGSFYSDGHHYARNDEFLRLMFSFLDDEYLPR